MEAAKTRNLAERQTIEELEFSFAVGRLDETGLWREVTELVAGSTASESALDAISQLFKPGDVVEIRCLDPHKKHPAESYCGRLDVPAERAQMVETIRGGIRNCRNVYFGINPRKAGLSGTSQPGSAADVVARRSVVLDLDLKDAPGMLESVSAKETAEKISASRDTILRTKYAELARNEERRRTQRSDISVDTVAGLMPWREVVEPHQDVATGEFQQAEFAADLAKVHNGSAPSE